MKGSILTVAVLFAVSAGIGGCRKQEKTKAAAAVAQDTMLLHDLAEANKNTAAAAAVDNSLNTVMNTGGAVPATDQTPRSQAADSRAVTRPAPAGSEILTPGTRIPAPTTARDAPGRTTVPLDRSPASGSQPSSGDPCDSPAAADQRTCLNRSIVANDADLNRTYQELIAQSRKSGGAELEDRIRQQQREWVNQRDAACRAESQNSGRLWARAVARCLADYSDKRTAELRRTLSGLRGQD